MPERIKEVLLVDDEQPFLDSLTDGLSSYSRYFHVRTALNGAEAVKALKLHPLDMVITDLCMPKMDGFELLAYMSRNYPKIPVVLMTAWNTPKIEEIIGNMGVFRYLEKPIDIDLLAEDIFACLKIDINRASSNENITAPVQTAFDKIKNEAEGGDAHAQWRLGSMYMDGKEVEQDYKEGIKWLKKSVEQGNINAKISLGFMYTIGRGVEANIKEALPMFLEGAAQGDWFAQLMAGAIYIGEFGDAVNYKEALKWLTKSAEQGHDMAQFLVGKMYFRGDGVDKNYDEAIKWFKKAVEQGHALSQDIVSKLQSFPAENIMGVTTTQKIIILQQANLINDLMKGFYDPAVSYTKEGRYGEAIFCLKELLERSSDAQEKTSGLYSLGQIMEQISKFEDAIIYYREASILCEHSSDLFYWINSNTGYSLCMLGQFADAEKYCRMAIELDSSRANAFKNLGISLEGQMRLREAIECYITATKINAKDVRATKNLEKLFKKHPELHEEYNESLEECKLMIECAKDEKDERRLVH